MSNEPEFDDVDYEADADAPSSRKRTRAKEGMSTGAKVAIILGICAGVLLLVCCGAGFYFFGKIGKSLTEDPAEIESIRQDIVSQIDIPAGFAPAAGFDFSIAGQGMKMAIYGQGTEQNPSHMLMLMKMSIQADPEQMRQEMQKSAGRQQTINVESSETKTVTIDGQEVDFRFAKGKTDKGVAVREVSGAFAGNGGAVMLLMLVPEEDWDEAQAIQVLESIKK
ncbi:MAG: hypothetical protein KDA75_03045 [Planctomycetaceae bacterium]|nr:hypothetical protein [Planctomycetaceae bacterium]